MLVAGTHIGKHVKEAVNAESRQVFINEMGVAKRKASETEYWMQLLLFADIIGEKDFRSIEVDREELSRMLTKIVKTSKDNG